MVIFHLFTCHLSLSLVLLTNQVGGIGDEHDLELVAAEEEDRISKLPHEVVVSIVLSLLTLKEAAATRILSRRWRCVWAGHLLRLSI